MFKQYFLFIFIFLVNPFAASIAQSTEELKQHTEFYQLKESLELKLGLDINSIKSSPMPGMVEMITNKGIVYATEDGKFLLQGKLYGLTKNIVNHTDDSLAQVRISGMKQFKDDMIIFPAKDEKYVITVFTDITCGYCRKMHKELDELNAKGITVRYLPYPRSGIKDRLGKLSQGFKDLRSIWCHEDPQVALTKAKLGSSVAQRICDSPIEAEFNFGRQIGVNSTPVVIFENGSMLPGYRDPRELMYILKNIQSQS